MEKLFTRENIETYKKISMSVETYVEKAGATFLNIFDFYDTFVEVEIRDFTDSVEVILVNYDELEEIG